ncbi:MAG: COX15/CtaA family protein [Thermoanaerobaculales bacterium]
MIAIAEREASRGSAVLALGFGTSVAMWMVGYLCRIPPVVVPSWALAAGLLLCLFAGGVLAGRLTEAGWPTGFASGVLSSLINLLVLGSLLGGAQPNHVVPSSWWWVPGSLLVGAALGGVGALVGGLRRASTVRLHNWVGAFAAITAAATLLQLLIGGVVTSEGAGLAVVDWPNSFGYNMFLYPLSRMTGGIYYEHAHRLFGSLVGLTTVVLALQLWRVERRAWVKRLGGVAVALVVVQGILGGLRVTGNFTLSTAREAMAPSTPLAIVHGVLGPVFFAVVVALAVFTSSAWGGTRVASSSAAAETERGLGAVLVAALLVQLVLGTMQRQLAHGLLAHVTFAIVVLVLALVYGARMWGLYPAQPLLQRLGRALMVAACAQVMLGLLALVAVSLREAAAPRPAWAVLLTTAHQATGAALLGLATALWLWTFRLLDAEPEQAAG